MSIEKKKSDEEAKKRQIKGLMDKEGLLWPSAAFEYLADRDNEGEFPGGAMVFASLSYVVGNSNHHMSRISRASESCCKKTYLQSINISDSPQ
jgi:hypothetical protein